MNITLKSARQFLLNFFLSWLLQIFIIFLVVTVLSLSLKDDIYYPVTKLLNSTIGEPPQLLLLWYLLLGLLLIILFFSFGIKYNEIRNQVRPYILYKQDGFYWSCAKKTGKVKAFPFCIEHRYEIIHKSVYSYFDHKLHDVYLCPECGNKHTKGITREKLTEIYEIVKKKIEAKHYGYVKGYYINL